MSKIKCNIDAVHNAFSHREEYKYLIWLIEEAKRVQFSDTGKCANDFELGKVAGRIDGLDWVIGLMTPENWLECPYDES